MVNKAWRLNIAPHSIHMKLVKCCEFPSQAFWSAWCAAQDLAGTYNLCKLDGSLDEGHFDSYLRKICQLFQDSIMGYTRVGATCTHHAVWLYRLFLFPAEFLPPNKACPAGAPLKQVSGKHPQTMPVSRQLGIGAEMIRSADMRVSR